MNRADSTDPSDQIRDALLRLKTDGVDPHLWLDEIAYVVLELGGEDAADLLQVKLDEVIGVYGEIQVDS